LKRFFGESKTVFRGGFAVNYDFFFNNILTNTAATVPNSFGVTNFGASLPVDTDPRGIARFGVGLIADHRHSRSFCNREHHSSESGESLRRLFTTLGSSTSYLSS
jgi:hypothetical protein